MEVQSTNLQQLCNAAMSVWSKISAEYFQILTEPVPGRSRAILKLLLSVFVRWNILSKN